MIHTILPMGRTDRGEREAEARNAFKEAIDMPTRYLALLRGINVGGKHKLPMTVLIGVFA